MELRTHDLEPDLTAPGVLVRDGVVTATCYLRDEDGAIVLDRDEMTGEVLGRKCRTVVQQLRAPLPEHLGRDVA